MVAAQAASPAALMAADAHMTDWPGWVRLADPAWLMDIEAREVERFDRSIMQAYTTTIRIARGLRRAPDPRVVLARSLSLRWIASVTPAWMTALAAREDLLGALGGLDVLPSQVDDVALVALGDHGNWE